MRDFREEGPDEAKEGRYIPEINTQPGACIRDCPSWIGWPDPLSSAKTNEVLEYYPLLMLCPHSRPRPGQTVSRGSGSSRARWGHELGWSFRRLPKATLVLRTLVCVTIQALVCPLCETRDPAGTQIPRVCPESPFPVWVRVRGTSLEVSSGTRLSTPQCPGPQDRPPSLGTHG
jgi:hypothetical protein